MTKKYGIIGNPIKHSLSPTLHNYWFEKYKIDANYSIIEIETNELPNLINRIKTETELGEYLNLPVKTYSSGMKFRLAFFTSLNVQSDILLLDEWIGTADQNLRDKVDKLILERIAKSKILAIFLARDPLPDADGPSTVITFILSMYFHS